MPRRRFLHGPVEGVETEGGPAPTQGTSQPSDGRKEHGTHGKVRSPLIRHVVYQKQQQETSLIDILLVLQKNSSMPIDILNIVPIFTLLMKYSDKFVNMHIQIHQLLNTSELYAFTVYTAVPL